MAAAGRVEPAGLLARHVSPEWSALALIEAPDTVRAAHAAFARAGAEVLTTNAYAVVPFHLGDERFEADGGRLAALSAELTQQAADDLGDAAADANIDLVKNQGRNHRQADGRNLDRQADA